MKNTIVSIATLILLSGCMTMNYNFPAKGVDRVVQGNKSRSYSVKVLVDESEAKKVFKGTETFFGETHNIESNVGESLKRKLEKDLSKLFGGKENLGELTPQKQMVVEAGLGEMKWEAWKKGINAHREVIIQLKIQTTVENSLVLNKTYTGKTKCEKWKCFSDGEEFGDEAINVLLGNLFIPGHYFTLDDKFGRLFEYAVNSAYQNAIDQFLREIETISENKKVTSL